MRVPQGALIHLSVTTGAIRGFVMDVKPAADGSWHFRLGPIERWVVLAVAAGFVGLCGYVVNEFKDRMDTQAKSLTTQGVQLQALVTQQAVTNEQLQALSRTLADVPGIVHSMAKMEVRVDEHERRIRELEQVRKLR